MKKLSMREFKDMCDSLTFNKFVLLSENQLCNNFNHTVNVKSLFKIMLILFNPNTICFKNADSTVCFERVKYIKINDDNLLVGLIFTIVCGDFSTNKNDVSYTIVAK